MAVTMTGVLSSPSHLSAHHIPPVSVMLANSTTASQLAPGISGTNAAFPADHNTVGGTQTGRRSLVSC